MSKSLYINFKKLLKIKQKNAKQQQTRRKRRKKERKNKTKTKKDKNTHKINKTNPDVSNEHLFVFTNNWSTHADGLESEDSHTHSHRQTADNVESEGFTHTHTQTHTHTHTHTQTAHTQRGVSEIHMRSLIISEGPTYFHNVQPT